MSHEKKDILVYLEDILESIRKIEEYTGGVTFEEFENNTEHQDAVIRRLEIIGEAVKHLSEKIKREHPEIPWRQIAGMRDVLIHEYAGVSLERVWRVVKNDLPLLSTSVSKLMTDLKR